MRVILKLCKVFDSPLEAHSGLTSAKEIENVPPSSPIPIYRVLSEKSVSSSESSVVCTNSSQDNHDEKDISYDVSVLSLYEVIDYIIPSFSVLQVKLRHAKVTMGDSLELIDVFFNDAGDFLITLPFSLAITTQCSVEVNIYES